MKFNKKTLAESLNQFPTGKKVYTEGKKQNIIISEEQFERLLPLINESKKELINNVIKEAYSLIRESITKEGLDLNIEDYSEVILEQGMYDRNPGIAAGEGIENILGSIKKAWEMIKDSDTRKKLANSITKLGNFLTYTAELVGSGSSQRAPRSYDQLANPLPHPEFEEEVEEDLDEDYFSELEEDTEGEETYHYGEDEGEDEYRLKHGDLSRSHRSAIKKDMGYDEEHEYRGEEGTHFESQEEENFADKFKKHHDLEKWLAVSEEEKSEKDLIAEDIKKMNQVIKPVSKSVLKEIDETKELHVNDGDLSFVNKWVFTSPPDAKYKRQHLGMENWAAMDDRQRKILMDNAVRISKGESWEEVHNA